MMRPGQTLTQAEVKPHTEKRKAATNINIK